MSVYAVNGKEPIAAWIPSLDTAGNGTTTLNNLIGGGGNGTLTNGPTWVSDTEAGGVRAISYDGINDKVAVTLASTLSITSAFSMSCWVKLPAGNGDGAFFKISGQTSNGFAVGIGNGIFENPGLYLISLREALAWHTTAFILGTGWKHVVASFTPNTTLVYIDGTLRQTVSGAFFGPGNNLIDLGGYSAPAARYTAHLGDDYRLFTQTLDSTDIAYLYNSGNGRGRVVSNNNSTFAIGMPI